ncbi:trimeric intracellular cation channel family protein [Desulforhopalus sp. 52FAK]
MGLIGIAAFAITGVIAAGKKGMDIFSVVLLGVVTALGGGTLRDVIIDSGPVFWTNDLLYLWISVAASVITFFLIQHVRHALKLLLFVDAFGLSLFTVLATEQTLNLGFTEPVAVLMGVITGIAGGMIRDILTGRMPLLLGREFYATPALLGAIVFCLLRYYFPLHGFNIIYAGGIIFILRSSAIQWGLYYPKWLIYSEKN